MNRDGPVMLITGASSGIGEATARRALAEGYRLVLGARGADRLTEVATALGAPERVLARPGDVSDLADDEALVAAALERFGRLDVCFANAGLGGRGGWLEEPPEYWREMVQTNVLGVAYTLRAAIPALLERCGHVVISGSVAGVEVQPGSFYSATKFAVHAIAESVRAEFAGTGLRTTLIAPGQVQTPFFTRVHAWRLDADDVARAVLYALSQPPGVDVNEVLLRPTHQPVS